MNREKKSIKINAFFNTIKSVLAIIFPLITFPYATRVLGVDNIGKVNYAQAVVSYFSLIAALGISTYAVREGSKIRDDKEKLNIFCNQVFTINIISSLFAYAFMIVCCVFVSRLHNYVLLICLLSVSIFFTTIGIDWLNVIFEDYVYITIRGFAIQIISLILLIFLVKNENDYYIYAFLTIVPQIAIGICNYYYCRKYCKVKLTVKPKIKTHIKSMVTLFVNNVAVTLYCNADSIMVGWFNSDYYVGVYAVAVKIYSMIRSLLASIFSVCIPRLSYYFGNNENEKFEKLISALTEGLLIIILPTITGVEVLSKEIILVISGYEYIGAVLTLRILCIGLIFAILGGIITSCINVPKGKEKINLYATFIAAILNIGLNVAFIPLYKQNGAAVTTVCAEFAVVICCVLFDKSILKCFYWKSIIKSMLQSIVGCVGIVISKLVVCKFFRNEFIVCIFTISLSVLVYGGVMFLQKNRCVINVVKNIRNRRI
ncbi:flippase [Ruminococcus sp. 1001136sp1]|uniref:flippase n=1 Tax=Ruminococcus sp. 1001136sp1 TaxID=2986996 RepID=UPI00321BCF5B